MDVPASITRATMIQISCSQPEISDPQTLIIRLVRMPLTVAREQRAGLPCAKVSTGYQPDGLTAYGHHARSTIRTIIG